jgi:hypothetical protein
MVSFNCHTSTSSSYFVSLACTVPLVNQPMTYLKVERIMLSYHCLDAIWNLEFSVLFGFYFNAYLSTKHII